MAGGVNVFDQIKTDEFAEFPQMKNLSKTLYLDNCTITS